MIGHKVNLHNRFDFEIYDIETGETQYAQAENIVLNAMWTRVCGGDTFFYHIAVGQGTGTLSPARTTLFSYLLAKASSTIEVVYDTDYTAHHTKSATFGAAEANGTWTEVGISPSASYTAVVTHALITDSEGNPITITKTNTKVITVYATVFAEVLAPTSPNSHRMFIGSDNYISNLLLDSGGFSAYTTYYRATELKRIDGSPSRLCSRGAVSGGGYTKDVANKRMYATKRFSISDFNHPIRGIWLEASDSTRGMGGISLPATGIFEHQQYTGVAVGTGDGATTQFDLPVNFPIPGSETIYVGGVAKTRGTDYTIHHGLKSTETKILDLTGGTFQIDRVRTSEEIIELPQPAGGEATITSIVIKNFGTSGQHADGYEVSLSLDGTTWVSAGSLASGWVNNNTVTLNGFSPAAYKYVKVNIIKHASRLVALLSQFTVNATPPAAKHISFASPPANGAAITADFKIDYINKTSNFVIDVQAEFLFGEGV